MPLYTDLVIDSITIPDPASRGIKFDLSVDPRSRQIVTDVMGEEIDISLPQFRKRILSISCSEHEKPMFDFVWPGAVVTVTMIEHLGIGNDSSGALTMEMMVGDWKTSHNEWEAQGDWSLELIEVRSGEIGSV
jgi:hypothetical protein